MAAEGQQHLAQGHPPAQTALTYSRLRPLTTRHTGRWKMSSRWWLTQKRTSICTGKPSTCGMALKQAEQQADEPGGAFGHAGKAAVG